MTKIQVLDNCMFTETLTAGDVLDLPEAWASRLVRGGHAVEVVEAPPVVEEVKLPEFKPGDFKPSGKMKGNK